MKIAIAQMNPCIGDLVANTKKILEFCERAHKLAADLVVFPELSLIGYPPKDLLLRDDFLHAQMKYLQRIGEESPVPAIVGAAMMRKSHLPFNAAVWCAKTGPLVVGKKILLPSYNVFDEARYFSTPVPRTCEIIKFQDRKLLISICEDAWGNQFLDGEQRYEVDPIGESINQHGFVDVIVNMSASPFTKSKPENREAIFTNLAKRFRTPVLLAGQVGANDQWLFDGHSMVINKDGAIIHRAEWCSEDLLIFDRDATSQVAKAVPLVNDMSKIADVLCMGIRDYVDKCGLPGVVIGVSGGIDSAVVCALAVKALGRERVKTVYLPSRFSSPRSFDDARTLTKNLQVELDYLLTEGIVQALRDLLVDRMVLGTKACDIADQNLQARVRGLIIMALSNLSDHIMLATSNKSELAVGYSTIYGDMCGAFSPIGDLYKTDVYRLAHELNRDKEVIPSSIIERPPTAELKADQLDSDHLPDYTILDDILFNFIEKNKSASEIESLTKQPRSKIDQVITMVNHAEYKRRQGPFSLMVSDRAFGDARRLPIAKRQNFTT